MPPLPPQTAQSLYSSCIQKVQNDRNRIAGVWTRRSLLSPHVGNSLPRWQQGEKAQQDHDDDGDDVDGDDDVNDDDDVDVDDDNDADDDDDDDLDSAFAPKADTDLIFPASCPGFPEPP